MENLGLYLKQFREDQGIEYITVYSDIRLREEQVKLMEENRFFELGPYGVVKAMVFNYARYLGADLDAVMTELKVLVPEVTKSHHRPARPRKQKKIMLSTNFLWGIGILVFVAILGGILFHAYNQGWLKTPQILKSAATDSLIVVPAEPPEPEQLAPDSTRLRMRQLTQELNAPPKEEPVKPKAAVKAIKPDSTDYINSFMGDSPVNVETR